MYRWIAKWEGGWISEHVDGWPVSLLVLVAGSVE